MGETEESISNLVARLPKFFSHRRKITINPKDVKIIIAGVKQELINEGEEAFKEATGQDYTEYSIFD